MTLAPAPSTAAASPTEATGLLGRPRWFNTLFGTDVWERFSFYGMTAILVLYATEEKSGGGLGLSNADATMIFGLYMATVFISSVPGGWIGDRVLGSYRAILYGGGIIALGHLCMTVPHPAFFYFGLLFIAAGTGLLKPNMANLLSAFYKPEDRAGRDAGFAIFYMSVQVSALIAPIVVGVVGERVNWHLGFGLAAAGMAAGLVQYARGKRHFGDVGMAPERAATPAQRTKAARAAVLGTVLVALVYGTDAVLGTFEVVHAMALIGLLCVVLPVYVFTRLLRNPQITAEEKVRVRTYIWLFLASAVFWAMFLQGGSVFTLFAKESTDREFFGATVPASWFHAAIPFFVLVTAPLFAWFWTHAGARFATVVKYSIGMACTGAAFLVMALAALAASDGTRVSPLWLLAACLLLAAGEVSFGPVGMSATTAIAPATFVSQMVGLFWMAGALGGGIGGNALKVSGDDAPGPGYFLALGIAVLSVGTALFLARRPLTKRLGV